MENLLSTHAVTKTYGKQDALRDVSIHVRPGEVYGLVGKNGAGKSTLFKVIMGLAVQDSGEVSIYDQPSIENLEGSQKNIGFMYGSQFFPYLNARKNLTYTCKLKGITDKTEVDRVLKLVELDKVKKKVKTFSMG
ncbi:MAG: ATP-binding cassette domain-containing protein, partial [Lactococcus lactis]|nr:ATP-binding cassette domain-containing protein [Lactococcus lactis]